MNERSLFLVTLGGAIGSLLRYLTASYINQKLTPSHWPWGTFSVNLIGSLAIGLLSGLWVKQAPAMEWRLILITGFLGGFTTFSAFAFESLELLQSKPLLMIGYATASMILGISFAGVGFFIGSR